MARDSSSQRRPPITGEEVSGWFRDAISKRRIPNAAQCGKLAAQINRYAGFRFAAHDNAPELLVISSKEAKSLGITLGMLQRLVGKDTIPEVYNLQLCIDLFLKDFPVGAQGRHESLWPKYYLRFLPIITETLEAATEPAKAMAWERRGHDWPTSATSPAIVVLANCLDHVFGGKLQPATLARYIIHQKKATREERMRKRSDVPPDLS